MDSHYSIAAKRAKYDSTVKAPLQAVPFRKESSRRRPAHADDIWGDDFAEEDIEEMDFIASQACLQDTPDSKNESQACDQNSVSISNHLSSIGKSLCNFEQNKTGRFQTFVNSQKSNVTTNDVPGTSTQDNRTTDIAYTDFKKRIVNRKMHNSTFCMQDNVTASGSVYAKDVEQLRIENQKLLNNFMTKEGEAAFLRKQLEQAQLKAESDLIERTRFLEEQASRHKSEITVISNEKERMKTQLDLQALEVANLIKRCKLLETGNVKLVEPYSASLCSTKDKKKCNTRNKRLQSSSGEQKKKEACVQTNSQDRSSFYLKTCNIHRPLAKIPRTIFDTPLPEKPIVDIKIIEKIGKRNLPILQDEDTFRIFENPDLVRPITTMIDNRKLTTEFILPEVAIIEGKTDWELESDSCVPIINKLASTARELILNASAVLRTIFRAMRDDDIRDMNDIYFSDTCAQPMYDNERVCDSSALHKGERGIEVRRIIGVLSYVASESLYLSKYITGKKRLLVENDIYYRSYSAQMVRYDAWLKKGHEFELLEILLEFVALVGLVRRSHQFSGLISAIIVLLRNAQKKVGYCEKGMDYVYRIFKEIVFCRPLSLCYAQLAKMLNIFATPTVHLQKLCKNSQSMAIKNWKGTLHFTADACPLQILLAQMESFHTDPASTVDITDALVLFMQFVLQTNIIPLRTEPLNSCNCCVKLLRFTIKMLYKCSEGALIITENVETHYSPFAREETSPSRGHVGSDLRKRCLNVLRGGIRFLCHLTICDPDFVNRLDCFHLFMKNIEGIEDLGLRENEREALDRVRSTFVPDKSPQSESQEALQGSTEAQLDISRNFGKRTYPEINGKRTDNREHLNKSLATIRTLYNLEAEHCERA
ncbi:hypothetical protein KM043_003315 [Ampulex compressa]|nr:hypothetical protein KM043_003315 [Ampulex compressa]